MQGDRVQGHYTKINHISSNKQLETEFRKAIPLKILQKIYIDTNIKICIGSIC